MTSQIIVDRTEVTVVVESPTAATISVTPPIPVTVTTSITGPQGIQGPVGPQGATGPQGLKGDTGDAATITVGSVTTGAPGSSATVANVGTSGAAILEFTIPRGATGIQGSIGPQGPKGDTGDPGIIVSPTAPANPQLNQLWVDTSQ